MESREKILELVRRFADIPTGQEEAIRSWIVDLNHVLEGVFGPDSQYLQYLKYLRFTPDVVFVTDKERERSWKQGVAQVDNLLHVILNDPKVSDLIILEPQAPASADQPTEESVERSLQDFNQAVSERYPGEWNQRGTVEVPGLADPATIDGPSIRKIFTESGSESGADHCQGNPAKILCIRGNHSSINSEVEKFLEGLPVEVMSIPNAAGQESLIDRLNKCVCAEFVIFILSADFHVYSKSQRPVDGGLMAPQEAIFELGYLTAKFNRQKIVVLYEETEEFMRPTEFFELFYVPVTNSGSWKVEVLRRMKGNLAVATGLGLSVNDQSATA